MPRIGWPTQSGLHIINYFGITRSGDNTTVKVHVYFEDGRIFAWSPKDNITVVEMELFFNLMDGNKGVPKWGDWEPLSRHLAFFAYVNEVENNNGV